RGDHFELALALGLEQPARRIAPPDQRARVRLVAFAPFQVEGIGLARRTAGNSFEADHAMLARMRYHAFEIFGESMLIQLSDDPSRATDSARSAAASSDSP